MEMDANALEQHLNMTSNDLRGGHVTSWIACIRQFDFDVKLNPRRVIAGTDSLSWRPREEGEPESTEQHNLEDRIKASLHEVQVD
jgi:hypothetical protein